MEVLLPYEKSRKETLIDSIELAVINNFEPPKVHGRLNYHPKINESTPLVYHITYPQIFRK